MGEKCSGREAGALIRLHVLAEGQTEEGFVNDVLAPELATCDVFADVHCITTGRRHGRPFRGGLVRYEHLARDLILWMKQDQRADAWFTTMIDLYRLPAEFPGRETVPQGLSAAERVGALETALAEDIAARLNPLAVGRRLVPYIQVHEFEALLFSDPACFAEAFPDQSDAVQRLQAIRDQCADPEAIDGGPDTAPSKRILEILPGYEKPVAGILIAQRIGLTTLRRECRHFDAWVTRLSELPSLHRSPREP